MESGPRGSHHVIRLGKHGFGNNANGGTGGGSGSKEVDDMADYFSGFGAVADRNMFDCARIFLISMGIALALVERHLKGNPPSRATMTWRRQGAWALIALLGSLLRYGGLENNAGLSWACSRCDILKGCLGARLSPMNERKALVNIQKLTPNPTYTDPP
jgi:hypothetical protein